MVITRRPRSAGTLVSYPPVMNLLALCLYVCGKGGGGQFFCGFCGLKMIFAHKIRAWTTLIIGTVQQECHHENLHLLRNMKALTPEITYNPAIGTCTMSA